jgi:hypothetical protein
MRQITHGTGTMDISISNQNSSTGKSTYYVDISVTKLQ